MLTQRGKLGWTRGVVIAAGNSSIRGSRRRAEQRTHFAYITTLSAQRFVSMATADCWCRGLDQSDSTTPASASQDTSPAMMDRFNLSRCPAHGRHWYAAVLVKAPAVGSPAPTQAQNRAGIVGVDLGVNRLATLSTGIENSYPNPRHLAAARHRLTRAQRALSRAQKGSNRRAKTRMKLAELHHRVAERRSGALHQITKHLSSTFETIAIEDLDVAGMTRSARGTITKPGRNVRQKAGLNRSILDAGFSEFRRQLTYKTTWYGSTLAVIDRYYPSSKTCSNCGTVKPKLPLSERTYRCDDCGTVMDRDMNAAMNIAATASAPAVPTAMHVASDKQETLNARRAHVRPTSTGGQCSMKREDPGISPHSA